MKFEWDSGKEKVNIEYVRIISARKASKKEQHSYQQRCKK